MKKDYKQLNNYAFIDSQNCVDDLKNKLAYKKKSTP